MTAFYRALFWTLARAGRPFGGVRPRRWTHAVAERAFPTGPNESDFRWVRDDWGSELRLNPYYYMDRTIIAFGQHERQVHRLLAARLRPGMVCFDVGANIGELTLHMARRVAPAGHVHAFEPAPLLLPRLRAHVARNPAGAAVTVHPVALCDREGSVEMATAPAAVGNQGMASLVNTTHDSLSELHTVPTTTLDAFVATRDIPRVDFMKIDIQGAEPLLLDGGRHVFGTLGPDLVMEVSPGDMAPIGRSASDLLVQLESFGYAVHSIAPDGTPARRLHGAQVTDSDFDGVEAVFCTKRPIA